MEGKRAVLTVGCHEECFIYKYGEPTIAIEHIRNDIIFIDERKILPPLNLLANKIEKRLRYLGKQSILSKKSILRITSYHIVKKICLVSMNKKFQHN